MKPVVICCYAPHEGPGHFATYLDRHRIPRRVVKLDESEPLPDTKTIGGLAMMGGPMSVNDDLPWVRPMLDFIRVCVDGDVPVIGHCLGGQLMARALGGCVTRNSVTEIGWAPVDVVDSATAALWGTPEPFLSFQWHSETFSIPAGAQRIWSSEHCANQAFAIGKHLAMQCHIEMTEEMIERWCESGEDEIQSHLQRSPAVQTAAAIREELPAKLARLNRVADRIYDSWTRNLSP